MSNDPHQYTPPPPPHGAIDYASAYAPQAKPTKSPWRFALTVVGVMVCACLLFMLLRGQNKTFTTIPYSEFNATLKPADVGPAASPDRIEWLRLSGDAVYGKFVKSEEIPDKGLVTYFKVDLPPGMGGHYPFFREMVDRAGMARFDVEPNDNLVINILLPLIPWLLIFGFIWFFVFRNLRKAQSGAQQILLSGPGRWIPDPPTMPRADAK